MASKKKVSKPQANQSKEQSVPAQVPKEALEKLKEIFPGLPPQAATVIVESVREEYSGPIPHPRILEEFDRVTPGAADRIIKMAENQAHSRQVMQAKEQDFRHRGQWFAFILVLLLIAACVYCAILGATIIGTTLAGAVTCVLGAYVYQKREERKK